MNDGTVTPDPEDIIFQIRGDSASPVRLGLAEAPVHRPAAPLLRLHGRLHRPLVDLPGRRRLRDGRPLAGQHLPARRQPLRARVRSGARRRRQLVRRRRHPLHRERAPVARPDGQPRRDRQARPHVGPRGRGGARSAARVHRGDAPPAVHREERGQAGRQDRRRAEGERAARRHADRDHRRPRGADGAPLPGRPRPGCREPRLHPALERDPVGLQLVLRQGDRRERGLSRSESRGRAAQRRPGGQPGLLLPGRPRRGLAATTTRSPRSARRPRRC